MKIAVKPKGINQVKYGFIGGIIVPILASAIFFITTFPNTPFSEAIHKLVSANVHTHVMSISVLPNLLLFFIFIWTDKLFAARGVIAATFVYTFIVYGVKFML